MNESKKRLGLYFSEDEVKVLREIVKQHSLDAVLVGNKFFRKLSKKLDVEINS